MKPKLKFRKAQVQAMKKLLKYYEGKIDKLYSCPLCDSLGENTLGCGDCVWVKETDATCLDAATNNYHSGAAYLRDSRNKEWTERRIKELKEWIKKYDV